MSGFVLATLNSYAIMLSAPEFFKVVNG